MILDLFGKTMARGLLTIAGAAAACVLLVYLIRRILRVSEELSRKLLHLSIVAVMGVWLYAFSDWRQAALTMALAVALLYPALIVLEQKPFFSFLSRLASERKKGELRKSLCVVGLMFVLVCAVCWGAFQDRSLALASIYAWGPGDAAAALVGKRCGKTKIGRDKKKSLEGSLAMFLLSWLCVVSILCVSGSFPFRVALPGSLLTAFVAAVVELEDRNGMDTVFCPLAAMAVLCLLRFVSG